VLLWSDSFPACVVELMARRERARCLAASLQVSVLGVSSKEANADVHVHKAPLHLLLCCDGCAV
jgi:ABC-type uncharacterized transport system permease subunit